MEMDSILQPKDIDWLHGYKNKTHIYMLSTRNTLQTKDTYRLRVRRWKINSAAEHWGCHEPPSGRRKKTFGSLSRVSSSSEAPGQRNLMGIPVDKCSKPQDPG